MKTTLLEYSKVILEKVSFDTGLFQKELNKALKQLVESDASELARWAQLRFGPQAQPVLIRVGQ